MTEYQRFWELRRGGVSLVVAAAVVGVHVETARLWTRQLGGVMPRRPAPVSGRYLSQDERASIAVLHAAGRPKAEIARELGRHPSTIGRELARNSEVHDRNAAGVARMRYHPGRAHKRAEQRARRPKPAKLARAVNAPLHDYVQHKLAQLQWSPEQISRHLPVEFPDRQDMRVSHETIYQALFVQTRGALRRELTAQLRTGRAVRRPDRAADQRRPRVPPELLISQRPAEAKDRAVLGHWEGDLIIGAHSGSAIGTLVERSTRFVMLLHLPGRHGACEVRDELIRAIHTLPETLRRSLTWDQGIELVRHAEITLATNMDIYFCDPHSPWQRGSNENTNGLLRQYFPKGTDLSVHSREHLDDIADRLNDRPRKTLGWKKPREALNELLATTT